MVRFTVFLIILLTVFLNLVFGRDFYVGMFRKNDLLVAQDSLYKERVPYKAQYAKYGRSFKCPITYFRVTDRLGVDNGPRVEVIRGGLRKNYIVLRLTSVYNRPISVNIYVGCENKISTTKRTTTTKKADKKDNKDKDKTTDSGKSEKPTSAPEEGKATEDDEKPADAKVPEDAKKPEDAEKPEGEKDAADATTADGEEAPAEDGASTEADTEAPADADPDAAPADPE